MTYMFNKFLSPFFLILLLLIGAASIGQSTNKIKSLIKLEDTVVKYQCIKDTSGKVLFWKENQDIILMMGANYFDQRGRRIKSISGHSNVGFTVWEYAFDSAGNEI